MNTGGKSVCTSPIREETEHEGLTEQGSEKAQPTLVRRAAAEAIGTAMLLAAIVGSGITGERLAGGNIAIALLANTVATGAALVALILTFGSISGAHFNPAVTVASASQGGIGWRDVPAYLAAQVAGAFAGVGAAHVMFGERLFFVSRHAREVRRAVVQRSVGDLRVDVRHLGLRAAAFVRRAFRRRRLHHFRLLVHVFHLFRESGGDAGAFGDRHLRGNSSRGRARLHRGSTGGCGGGDRLVSLALALSAGNCRSRHRSTR